VIVKELDSFNKQKESLININNEMNTFKKAKFDMLLSACENKQTVKLGDMIKVSQGEYITKDTINNGSYPIYGGGDKSGIIDKYNRENQYIIAKDGISEKCVRYISGKFFTNHHAWTYQIINEKIKYHFIGTYLINIQENIYKLASGTAQKGINQESFYSIQIQLPSLELQQMIINQMESYDKLVELQQKQIDEIDKIVKERFDYHLNKCKLDDEQIELTNTPNELSIKELDDESVEEKTEKKPKKEIIKKESIEKLEEKFSK